MLLSLLGAAAAPHHPRRRRRPPRLQLVLLVATLALSLPSVFGVRSVVNEMQSIEFWTDHHTSQTLKSPLRRFNQCMFCFTHPFPKQPIYLTTHTHSQKPATTDMGEEAADAPGSELALKGLDDDTPEPIPNAAIEVRKCIRNRDVGGLGYVISNDQTRTWQVYVHAVTRGAQVGGLVAALGAVPYHFWRPASSGRLLRRMGTASILGCVGGGLFLAVGVYQKLAASDEWGIYDRAYRLRHNSGQVGRG